MYFYALFMISLMLSASFGYKLKNLDKVEDYFWRDYTGAIPKDALSGGYDSNKITTYIAQVLYKSLLVPGEIRDGRAFYEYGFKELNTTENVKILCTKHPKKFQWVITTKDDFKTLVNKDFVPGGYEPNNRMFIGRKFVEDELIVGKVQILLPSLEAVFHYPKNGTGHFDYSFEILNYL